MRERRPGGLLAAALVALVLALVLGAAPAAAHTELESAEPADGAVLTSAPVSVRLVFNEAVQDGLAQVVVTGPGGRLAEGPAQTDGPTVTQPLSAGGDGTYTLGYRVVADDGHPVVGELSFTVSAPTPEAGPSVSPAATPEPGRSPVPTPSASPAASAASAAAASGAEPSAGDRTLWPYAAAALGGIALVGAGLRAWTRRR